MTGLALAACSPAPSSASGAVSAANELKLLDVGGVGQAVTPTFTSSGSSVRVDFRLSRPPNRPQVTIIAEREGDNGIFQAASTASQTISGLKGSATLSLIPGRYRLRMDTDVPWSATIFEPKP